jgi:hypothetical protein
VSYCVVRARSLVSRVVVEERTVQLAYKVVIRDREGKASSGGVDSWRDLELGEAWSRTQRSLVKV